MNKTILTLTLLLLFITAKGYAQENLWTDEGNYDTTWYNETDTEFTLTTAPQLAGLAKLVNSGNEFYGKTIKMGTDIDLGAHCWWPIGADSKSIPAYYFKGTFDGEKHKISRLNMTEKHYKDLYSISLFGRVDGIICNLTLDESCNIHPIIELEDNHSVVLAGFVGYLAYSSDVAITNCINKASIAAYETNENSFMCVAGIAGQLTDGTISQCENYGSLKGDYVGGIVNESNNYNRGTITHCQNHGDITQIGGGGYAGGIVATGNKIMISHCGNYANIISASHTSGLVSGIIGKTDEASIEYCENSGSITGKHATGIAGNSGYRAVIQISNCNNKGNINGRNSASGILNNGGRREVVISDCKNSGNISAQTDQPTDAETELGCTAAGICISARAVINCCNYGKINASARNIDIPSAIGYNAATYCYGIAANCEEIYNCFNRGDISANSYAYNSNTTIYTNYGDACATVSIGGIGSCGFQNKVVNCYNTGLFSATTYAKTEEVGSKSSTYKWIGGIAGRQSQYISTIKDCYYANEGVDYLPNKGTIGFKPIAEMKSQSFADLLNSGRTNLAYEDIIAATWNLDGESGLPDLDIQLPTAIENIYADKYTNPPQAPLFVQTIVSGFAQLNLKIEAPILINIYTQAGLLTDQYTTDNGCLDMSQYPQGIYIVTVQGKDFKRSGRIIVQHE